MFRDFQASKGKLFLWTITLFGLFLLFLSLGLGGVSYVFLISSFIYGSVWFYKVQRDAKAAAASHQPPPPSVSLPPRSSAGSNAMRVPPPLSRDQ